MSWEPPVFPTTVIISVLVHWWFSSPTSRFRKFLYAVVLVAAVTIDPVKVGQQIYKVGHDAVDRFRLAVLLKLQSSMVLIIGAALWYVSKIPCQHLLPLRSSAAVTFLTPNVFYNIGIIHVS